MPCHYRHTFDVDELQDIQLAEPFTFTKGCRSMKISGRVFRPQVNTLPTLLFDLHADPKQELPSHDRSVEKHMIEIMLNLMRDNDCPPEQLQRLGLPQPVL